MADDDHLLLPSVKAELDQQTQTHLVRNHHPDGLAQQKIGAMSDGMSYQEAYHRAAMWWNKKGRKRMKKVANYREEGGRYSHGKIAIKMKPFMVPELTESGIMMAKAWDDLNMRERARITVIWHQEFIIKPQLNRAILPDL